MAYLGKATGLPVLCNEMGQQGNEDPSQVARMMQTSLNLDLAYVVWYSADVPAYGQARALHNSDATLRPNGEAYRDFIRRTFR